MSDLRWDADWRASAWQRLDRPWDVIVVGGGIVGAGVLRAAASRGLRGVLLEQEDFAWGTSSRSTKLIHGGLRYLAQGHVRLTREAVREREHLLREASGLVTPMPFILPLYAGQLRRRVTYATVLNAYEGLAGRRRHHAIDHEDVRLLVPALDRERLRGGLRYLEAETDDARLVLRVLREAVAAGALALNAVKVEAVRIRNGRVDGVHVTDRLTGRSGEVLGRVVVNATGCWADRLRSDVGGAPRMRPVVGSHLLFPGWRFPLAVGVNVRSPRDGRHISVFPWEGATLVGTTDLGVVAEGAGREASITSDQVSYLLECLQAPFASLALTEADVLSTWSGVRPIVASGAADSRDEPREHAVWDEMGMLTVAGGKLTTFALIARDVMRAASPVFATRQHVKPLPSGVRPGGQGRRDRLSGRFGADLEALRSGARQGDWEPVAESQTTWAELRWSARSEAVNTLEDLMLRRTRLGLLLPLGGRAVLDRVLAVCAEELGWDVARQEHERVAYAARIASNYSVPAGTSTVSPSRTASIVTGKGPKGSPSA